jgi:hypothetical protein
MSRFEQALFIAGLVVWSFTVGMTVRVSSAQKVDKSVPKQERTLALGEEHVKDLLLLMDTDRNGMISKAEFMRFMEAEFDRLDTDHSGELDIKELKQSRIQVNRPQPIVGK